MILVDQEQWNGRKQFLALPDQRRLAFIDTGSQKPVLLLLHGYSDSSRSYSLVEPYLNHFRLIIPDLAGHGQSDARDRLAPKDFADDIAALLEQLCVREHRLVGHSLGGMVAIEMAARGQHGSAGLITISSNTSPAFPADSPIPKWIEAMVDPIDEKSLLFSEWQACEKPVDLEFLAHLRREAAAMPAAVWQGVMRDLQHVDLTEKAGSVFCPVLCIGGSEDPLFPLSYQTRLAATFSNARSVLVSHSRCLILAGHGHNPHWESPGVVAKAIRDFFQPHMLPRSQQ